MERKPNLFEFATSELSQDAFICWLLSYVNYEKDKKLNQCAKDFVALLYNLKHNSKVSAEDIRGIEIKRQFHNIDIYFEADIKGKKVPFIIEDKTYTSHHSDQLKRYQEKVIENGFGKDQIVCIYFKTGYTFFWDKNITEFGYHLFDCQNLVDFLNRHDIDSDIFVDYKQNITSIYQDSQRNISKMDAGDLGYFKYDYVQFEYMSKLYEKLIGDFYTDCPTDYYIGKIHKNAIDNGSNPDGSPWTHLGFVYIQDAYCEGIGEYVFYRLDGRINKKTKKYGYYLSLRHYATVIGNQEAIQKKFKKFDKLREMFQKIDSSMVANASNRGTNESEIAVLFFDSEDNTPQKVLQKIPQIHKRFCDEIHSSGLFSQKHKP